ncbi:MAG: DUF192 domain-containing protein [Verrucomicrobiota bacterium]
MNWRWRTFVWVACLWLAIGCDSSDRAKTPSPAPTNAEPRVTAFGYLDRAQPKLTTLRVWLGPQELTTELALTDVQRMTGMMYRTNMTDQEAMLFVFNYPSQQAFYMRNTKVPLSAAYVDSEGVIREIVDLHPLNETAVPSVSDQIQYVLEVPQGWFKRKNIGAGTIIRTERGTLAQTFFTPRR